MNLKDIYFNILLESSKEYKNVTHGTSKKNALQIQKQGFKLPPRKALFFDANGLSGNLHQVYGSDALIVADLFPRKPITMKLVKGIIFKEMIDSGELINEINVHDYLIRNGYDLIDNQRELIVLDPKIIKLKNIKI